MMGAASIVQNSSKRVLLRLSKTGLKIFDRSIVRNQSALSLFELALKHLKCFIFLRNELVPLSDSRFTLSQLSLKVSDLSLKPGVFILRALKAILEVSFFILVLFCFLLLRFQARIDTLQLRLKLFNIVFLGL